VRSLERRFEPRWNALPASAPRAAVGSGAELLGRLRPPPAAAGRPHLACVVLAYRDPPSLVAAVASLVRQQPPLEIVVVNSGGGDPAGRLQAHGLDVPVLTREDRLLVGGARNVGIAATRAPFVGFLAADCIAGPGWARGRLRAHAQGALAVSSAVTSSSPRNPYAALAHMLRYNQRLPGTPAREAIHYGLSYARTLFGHFGLFRDDLPSREDTEFHARWAGLVPITWAPDVHVATHHPTTLPALLLDEHARARAAARTLLDLTGIPHGRILAGHAVTRLPGALRRSWVGLPPSDRRRLARALPVLPLVAAAYGLGALREAGGWRRQAPRVLALLQCRNERRYLPGYLANLEGQVDGIVALDDGSEDGSADVLARHPAVLEVIRLPARSPHAWDEPRNRRLLIEAGRRHGAAWCLAVDADERLERTFRRRMLRAIDKASRAGRRVCHVKLRELWDAPDTWRADGIWGTKVRARLFDARQPLVTDPRPLHGPWAAEAEVGTAPRVTDAVIYHLRMIDAAERAARRARYEALDPEHACQDIGYDYLTDVAGLRLERIPRGRGYRGGPAAS
jgi:glycosyltransferase involved in cell wall biosynthesis